MGLEQLEEIHVLNLIITGIPSIPTIINKGSTGDFVLNLIITGIPSILSNPR